MTMNVWFNKGLSNLFDALRLIRAADEKNEIILFASHDDPHSLYGQADCVFEIEPTHIDDEAYVAWCLAFCARNNIDLFVPQRKRAAIARRRRDFEMAGTRLSVMGEADILDMVERKHALYEDLAGSGVPVPPWRMARTLEEFDAAWADLRGFAKTLCVKPDSGIFGAGFRILEEEGDDMKRLLSGDITRLSLRAFRTALGQSTQNRDLMVMPYLPGPERSVDVLAHQGRMVRAIARVKQGNRQNIEIEGAAVTIARMLVERYALDGVFNLQTRDWEGESWLLEINSRMSGGLLFACQAGIALPYWSILLALGKARPDDAPQPKSGVTVFPYQACLAQDSA